MQRLEETLQGIARFMGEHQSGTAGKHSSGAAQGNGRGSPASGSNWEDLQDKLAVVTELVSELSGNGSSTASVPPTPSLISGISSSFAALSHPSPQPFPIDTFNLDVSPFHPASAQIRTSWQAFLVNIDPLVKVLHRSTTERILFKAARDPTRLSSSETAIVFTIYFSTLSTLSEDDAQRCFGIPKKAAQSTFKSAADHALAKTNLLAQTHADTDLTSLQAIVLFLSLGRFNDRAPRVWALTGLARRLDSVSAWKTSSPFEEEIRRRLRWELWCLDHRAHEDSGRGPAPLDTGGAPELPLNVRDADLDASLPATPPPGPGWTEISFSLVRFEIARTARTIEFLTSTSQKLAMVDECERTVQARYLRYCDGSEPVHWLAQHVAHVLLMELRFKLLRQDQPSPYSGSGECTDAGSKPAQDRLFLQAIDIVDTERRIEAEPQAKQWSWLLVGYMQFWPLSFLLSELRYRHGSEEVERGWEVAERALARRKEDDVSKNMETLRRLMEEARLERSHRASRSRKGTVPTGISEPFEELPSSCSAGMGTPTFMESFAESGIHGQVPGSDGCGSLGYMGLENPLLPHTYGGLVWDGAAFPADGAPGSLDFTFDDGDTFTDFDEVGTVPAMPYML